MMALTRDAIALYALVLLLAAPWPCHAAASSDWQFEAGVETENITRGMDISDRKPSVHAAATWYPGSGFFAGTSVSSIRSPGGSQTGAKFVTDAGYTWRLGNDWGAQVALSDYRFTRIPYAYRIDYDELVLSAGWRDSIFASIGFSPNTGMGPSPRSWAVAYDLVGRVPLSHGFSATAGIGYYDLRQEVGGGYAYGNAGLTYQYHAWQFDVSYVATRASAAAQAALGGLLVNRWYADAIWHF
ncbi:hypothetical protein FAZ69_28735 [Trinickia terrae]|uniref:Cellulose biosynthesis protein BcsS n=1 Tax=Trinickia terrae TaxID=2571161 RepID=A0A4U1HNK6_9BURK|nr:TorF family putative porin [Trinickia terrae]TKC81317.1 hypothetical protein FAZ69_28735 [Trinickia terrae]